MKHKGTSNYREHRVRVRVVFFCHFFWFCLRCQSPNRSIVFECFSTSPTAIGTSQLAISPDVSHRQIHKDVSCISCVLEAFKEPLSPCTSSALQSVKPRLTLSFFFQIYQVTEVNQQHKGLEQGLGIMLDARRGLGHVGEGV